MALGEGRRVPCQGRLLAAARFHLEGHCVCKIVPGIDKRREGYITSGGAQISPRLRIEQVQTHVKAAPIWRARERQRKMAEGQPRSVADEIIWRDRMLATGRAIK